MVFIRVDTNEIIATGHLMRCLAIADALVNLGEKVTFVFADKNGCAIVKDKYNVIVLDTKWDDMDSELNKLIPIIKMNGVDKLIIDSYQVTEKYLSTLKKYVKTIYIDDINAFNYDVNELICYTNYYKKNEYERKYINTKLCLGCKYTPLRLDFANLPPRIINRNVRELLIMIGGNDINNYIQKILECIKINEYKKINVICGRYNKNYNQLCNKYNEMKNINIIKSVDNIVDYMLSADMAISAGGVTLYELCACGTPTLSYAIADNQIGNVTQFDIDGVIKYIGDLRKCDFSSIMSNELEKFCNDYQLRKNLSMKMKKYVSGDGAFNIAREVIDL